MILIGENIHVISKQVREALINRDKKFISQLIKIQSNMDYIDLNVGPAKGEFSGILTWLAGVVEEESGLNISFDTTNADEMEKGLESFKGDTFINSTSADEPRLSKMITLALRFNSNLIALTLSKDTGIPKTSDGRMEIAFNIYEQCLEKGINNENLFFDPLVLPVCVEQSQGLEAINTIKMVKESFDPPVKTVIGLSNISNGSPAEIRPLINRVYGTLAFGAGLDAAIIDAKDCELVRIFKMLENNTPENDIDRLYIKLVELVRNFEDISEIDYNKDSKEQIDIVKAARIILNQEVYTHSFTQI